MSTPSYLGTGQPNAAQPTGWLARLGSLFGGGGAPSYLGAGQPAPSGGGGFLRPASPAYVAAPVAAPIAPVLPDAIDASALDAPAYVMAAECPIDPTQLAAGSIAIVIPRDRHQP